MRSFHKISNNSQQRSNQTMEKKFRSLHQNSLKQKELNSVCAPKGRPVPIYLIYKKTKLIIKAYSGMPYAELNAILFQELMTFERKKCTSLKETTAQVTKVLGFCTSSGDLNIDYLLSLSQGKVNKSLCLECFMESRKENRVLNYQIYNCLAIGGFSKVYLSRSKEDGKFYAVKFIKKGHEDKNKSDQSIMNEMKIGQHVEHPFLISMRESFETQGFYCMVFEYCPGGELFYLLKRIKTMSQEDAKFYFIQILLAIEYLHQNKIIYRDLKPQNILIDSVGNAKLVDFGLSKILVNKQKTFSYCGSAEYMAPEMVLRRGHSYSIDYYSLGALLYELVAGLPPFYSKDPRELEKSIVKEKLQFPSNIEFSPEIKDFLGRLLQKDSRFRLGAVAGVKEIMVHPWMGKINTQNYINKTVSPPFPPDLSSHNFDINQLGDDEQEFTHQIYLEFSHKVKKITKTHFKPKNQESSHPFESIINRIMESMNSIEMEESACFKNTELVKQKASNEKMNTLNSIFFEQKERVLRDSNSRKLHTLTFSERNGSGHKSRNKNMPYKGNLFHKKAQEHDPNAKNGVKGKGKENHKKIPRASMSKLNKFQNLAQKPKLA